MEQTTDVPEREPRIEGGHEANWLRACRGEEEATSPFGVAARLSETKLLGVVALRTGPGVTIHYDADVGEITNVPEANYLTRTYREGWELS